MKQLRGVPECDKELLVVHASAAVCVEVLEEAEGVGRAQVHDVHPLERLLELEEADLGVVTSCRTRHVPQKSVHGFPVQGGVWS